MRVGSAFGRRLCLLQSRDGVAQIRHAALEIGAQGEQVVDLRHRGCCALVRPSKAASILVPKRMRKAETLGSMASRACRKPLVSMRCSRAKQGGVVAGL